MLDDFGKHLILTKYNRKSRKLGSESTTSSTLLSIHRTAQGNVRNRVTKVKVHLVHSNPDKPVKILTGAISRSSQQRNNSTVQVRAFVLIVATLVTASLTARILSTQTM